MEVFPYSYVGIKKVWYRNRAHVLNPTENPISTIGLGKGRAGRPMKYTKDDLDKIKDLPLLRCRCLRSLSMQIGIPKTTLIQYLKQALIKKTSVNMKPALTDRHIEARMKWCEGFVSTCDRYYHDLMEYFHLDEKWFYLGHVKNHFSMLLEEALPHFMCQNKILL